MLGLYRIYNAFAIFSFYLIIRLTGKFIVSSMVTFAVYECGIFSYLDTNVDGIITIEYFDCGSNYEYFLLKVIIFQICLKF